MSFFRSDNETHSSTLCIVLLTSPNSRHGEIFLINLASEVPPVVENFGFILVIFFIIYKYKIFGVIANTALIANLLMLIGMLTILEATLTLPGIAGIILTVGMAVDANVLIFERIREELKNEKNNLIAFDSGYTKSRTAILDANITTLLAAVILFFMGSGPIKGFSLTLGVGIFTTLFSVYFIARLLTVLYVSKNKEKERLI